MRDVVPDHAEVDHVVEPGNPPYLVVPVCVFLVSEIHVFPDDPLLVAVKLKAIGAESFDVLLGTELLFNLGGWIDCLGGGLVCILICPIIKHQD